MKKINYILSIINLIAIFLFWLRFSAPIVEISSQFFPNSDAYSSFLAAQANHYALLQLYLVIFSIILAGAAFWGYNEIKKAAESSVSKAIKDSMPDMIQKHLESVGREQIVQISVGLKMENPSQNNTK